MYAYVAFPIANYQQFIYVIPSHLNSMIKEGVCVEASFRNKIEFGFVVSTLKKHHSKIKLNLLIELLIKIYNYQKNYGEP